MGRMYTVSFTAVAVTAQQDFFDVAPATNKPVAICGLFLGQSSDAGDTEDEMLSYIVVRGNATVGSVGTSATPAVVNPNDTAAGMTARVNDTTIASTGTAVTLHADNFNVRAGEKLWLPPECVWYCTAGETRICVRLNKTPADSLTMSGTLYVAELV